VVGAGRILEVLRSRGIASSWHVPGVVIKTYPQACEAVVWAGHKFGHHGWSHVPPAQLEPAREAEEFALGVEAIRALTGHRPSGYRSPAWALSDRAIDLLLEHGLDCDSAMMGHDCLPCFHRLGDVVLAYRPMIFGPRTRMVEIPISWSLGDHPHFEFVHGRDGSIMPGLANASAVLENWIADFECMRRTAEWGMLTQPSTFW